MQDFIENEFIRQSFGRKGAGEYVAVNKYTGKLWNGHRERGHRPGSAGWNPGENWSANFGR